MHLTIRVTKQVKLNQSLNSDKLLTLSKLITQEFKRRIFDESYPRIFKCLDSLSEEQVWFSPNKHSNSIGNLVLHLEGNLRQWMSSTFNENEDHRKRSEEFTQSRTLNKKEIKGRLIVLKNEVLLYIDSLSDDDLERNYPVQVYKESGISIIIHVIEHFSYHTGQIAYITKQLDDKDLNFYSESLE